MTDISKKARVEKITEGIKRDLEDIKRITTKVEVEMNYLNDIVKGGYN